MTELNRPKNVPVPPEDPSKGAGAHEKAPGEEIKSRSADPGQSSYGGFKGEDPRRQSQDLNGKGNRESDSKGK